MTTDAATEPKVIEGELVDHPSTAITPRLDAADTLATLAKDQDKGALATVRALNTLNWKDMKPPEVALLLMQKPFPISGGGTTYLTLKQALLFATGCYEMGLSPFSNQVWFDPNKCVVNPTFEGKKVIARNREIDLGPPNFERMERNWDKVNMKAKSAQEAKNGGFPLDVGYKCTMRVGKDSTSYTAWLSEWYVGSSPMWANKPEHMLQVRSAEKALTMTLGTGGSALPDEAELS